MGDSTLKDYITGHPKGRAAETLAKKYGKWVTSLEVRRCLAAGMDTEKLRRHVGRGNAPIFTKRPLAPRTPLGKQWGDPSWARWRALSVRAGELAEASNDFQTHLLLKWFGKQPIPQNLGED